MHQMSTILICVGRICLNNFHVARINDKASFQKLSLGAVVIGSLVPSSLTLYFDASSHQIYYPAKMCDHVNAIVTKRKGGGGG